MKLLKQLYFIHSPSRYEHGMQGFIRSFLADNKIPFFVDEFNQTYNMSHKDKPLLVAHTDQVGQKPLTKIIENKNFISGDKNIGADDKNGIWIVLNILKKYPKTNFIFSVEEESGGKVYNLLSDESVKDIPYALVFDRKGGSDIIGYDNGYCSEDFENLISDIGFDFGYKPAIGVYSDCDTISEYLNCVNLSCGYHQAHTDKEYTDKKELITALELGLEIVKTKISKDDYPVSYKDDEYDFSWYKKSDFFSHEVHYCHVCGEELTEDITGFYCMYCMVSVDIDSRAV